MVFRSESVTSESRATGSPLDYHEGAKRPTSAQVLRQFGLVVLVVALWGALFVGYLHLIDGSDVEPASMQLESTAVVEAPTHTPTQPIVDVPTPTQLPVDTPAPTEESTTEVSKEPTSLLVVSFSADVLPLLESRCARCHGSDRSDAGLSLISYADLMAGSRSGPVVVVGDASASLLVELIVSGEMPRRGPQMLPAEIEIISAWVDAGALDN
jgi:hypothetical protein